MEIVMSKQRKRPTVGWPPRPIPAAALAAARQCFKSFRAARKFQRTFLDMLTGLDDGARIWVVRWLASHARKRNDPDADPVLNRLMIEVQELLVRDHESRLRAWMLEQRTAAANAVKFARRQQTINDIKEFDRLMKEVGGESAARRCGYKNYENAARVRRRLRKDGAL
jgi:hypothetical protein